MTGSDALIYRLIFNLTENAVKYNRPGGSVRVSVTQELEKLLLRVSDTGCGIPEEYQRSIFQPSSGWTSLAAGNTAAQDWGSHWYGRSPTSTAALFGWRKVRRRARPSRWSCRQGRRFLRRGVSHNSPRRFHDDRFQPPQCYRSSSRSAPCRG